MPQRSILVVFVKAPVLGTVKTRLAAGLGHAASRAFYCRMLRHVLRRLARDRRWRTVLAITPDRFAGRGRWFPRRLRRIGQGSGDLGQRMGRALAGRRGAAIAVVGSDIPEVEPRHIASAFAALGATNVVLGPARDGGYWLVAARGARRNRVMFRGVRWSKATTLEDTVFRLGHGRVRLVDRLDDVDDPASYEDWRRRERARLRPSWP